MTVSEEAPQWTPSLVAGRVAEIIRARPAEHDQNAWFAAEDLPGWVTITVAAVLAGGCETTCCAAGWAAVVAAPEGARLSERDSMVIYADGRRELIEVAGARALGFSQLRPVPWLFEPQRTRDEVLAELDRIAAGGDPRDR